jgi:serine/threonine protein kinase
VHRGIPPRICGLSFLDIKGANVLVDHNGVVKLADFGCAKKLSAIVDGEQEGVQSFAGTIYWMAPEVIRQENLGRSADIWSLGCTVFEMATGHHPWTHYKTQVMAMYNIAQGKAYPNYPAELSDGLVEFMKVCFQQDPKARPNVRALLSHPFLQNIEGLEEVDELQKYSQPIFQDPSKRFKLSKDSLTKDYTKVKAGTSEPRKVKEMVLLVEGPNADYVPSQKIAGRVLMQVSNPPEPLKAEVHKEWKVGHEEWHEHVERDHHAEANPIFNAEPKGDTEEQVKEEMNQGTKIEVSTENVHGDSDLHAMKMSLFISPREVEGEKGGDSLPNAVPKG